MFFKTTTLPKLGKTELLLKDSRVNTTLKIYLNNLGKVLKVVVVIAVGYNLKDNDKHASVFDFAYLIIQQIQNK